MMFDNVVVLQLRDLCHESVIRTLKSRPSLIDVRKRH